jgi:hypothetical protein
MPMLSKKDKFCQYSIYAPCGARKKTLIANINIKNLRKHTQLCTVGGFNFILFLEFQ